MARGLIRFTGNSNKFLPDLPPSMTLSLYIVYRSDNVFTAYRYIKPRSMLPPRLETFAQLSRPANSPLSTSPTQRWNESWSVLHARRAARRERPSSCNWEPLDLANRKLLHPPTRRRVHHPRTNSFLLRERGFRLTDGRGGGEARRRDVSSVVSRLFPGGRNRVGAEERSNGKRVEARDNRGENGRRKRGRAVKAKLWVFARFARLRP